MKNKHLKKFSPHLKFWLFLVFLPTVFLFFAVPEIFSVRVDNERQEKGGFFSASAEKKPPTLPEVIFPLPLDEVTYNQKMIELANNPPPKVVYETVEAKETDANGKIVVKKIKRPVSPQPTPHYLWPAKTALPNGGAILPFSRVVAYYGNLYSKKMGVLGEYREEEMLQKLMNEVLLWQKADPSTPVIPALHYIAVVAQASAGQDGKYRARMPFLEIEKILKMAEKINAIVFLDIQVGLSDIKTELPLFEKYLRLPNVHLGIDPEFSMKTGVRPGKIVGTYDAEDVNFAIEYLAKIVRENKLSPKILVVHRYTQKMLTNFQNIQPLSEVQVVINMDGWGGKSNKLSTYQSFVYKEPVQFTGFKIFYKNDILESGTILFTPEELLKLNPRPIYIQYQ